MAWNVSALLASYLLGAVPFGYIIVRLTRGADVRVAGSGSTGATNVTRAAGLKAGLMTYLLDVAKGAAAVGIMLALTDDTRWLGAAAVFAILGHMYPVFLGFKGGKGVATGVGTYLLIVPFAVLSTLAVWILLFLKTRTVSLASLVATVLVPVWILVWHAALGRPEHPYATALIVGVGCALVIAKHHANIRRLVTGTENDFRAERADASGGSGAESEAAGR